MAVSTDAPATPRLQKKGHPIEPFSSVEDFEALQELVWSMGLTRVPYYYRRYPNTSHNELDAGTHTGITYFDYTYYSERDNPPGTF